MDQALPVSLAAFNALDPHEQDARAAGALRAHLATRVATRALHPRSGDEASAYESVKELQGIVRELLVENPQAQRFDRIALALLDHVIQPRIDRWSHWHVRGELDDAARQKRFRSDLGELQTACRRAMLLLDVVKAGDELEPDHLWLGPAVQLHARPKVRSRRAEEPTTGELRLNEKANLDDVAKAERTELKRRGHVVGDGKLAGLAISGGGIRSATFALGVLEVLSQRGLLHQFHYQSTVSGGGYLGTFLTSFLNDGKTKPDRVLADRENEHGEETKPVRHLRNRSRYLADGGLRSWLSVTGTMIFGILTNVIALLPLVLAAILVTGFLRTFGFWGEWPSTGWKLPPIGDWASDAAWGYSAAFWSITVVVGLQLVVRPIVSLFTRAAEPESTGHHVREAFGELSILVSLIAAVLLGLALLPAAFELYRQRGCLFGTAGAEPTVLSGGAVLALAPLRKWLGDRKRIGAIVRVLMAVSGYLFLLSLFVVLGWRLMDVEAWKVLLGLVVVFAFLWCFMDLNALSPHPFYRRRLASCYLVRRNDDHGDVELIQKLKLSDIGTPTSVPYPLLNATVNLPASEEPELRGRRGDFFLFSPRYCGSTQTGYWKTPELEKSDGAIDLASAMAISGAAFSSNMAASNLQHLRFLLALLNVRLGYWIPTLGRSSRLRDFTSRLRLPYTPGPWSLLKEMFGRMDEKFGFLNLSDGGHIENLGVYELLRRRCKFIVAVDGECDPERVFDGFVKLDRYARIDLGTTIDIDLGDLALDEKGNSRAHAAFGQIDYGADGTGWLLYVKLSVTGDEALGISDYRRVHEEFPHQTTLDQIYSERQFDAYKELGRHAALEMFENDWMRAKSETFAARSHAGETSLGDWFDALAMNMLPDDHPVFRPDPTNLEGLDVGISISKSPMAGLEPINDATLAVCRRLISLGARVVLGHDWRTEGVMAAIAKHAEADGLLHDRSGRKAIVNRHEAKSAYPIPEEWAAQVESDTAPSLTSLRSELAELSNARICLGGKVEAPKPESAKRAVLEQASAAFSGSVPGVLEEAWRSRRTGIVLVSGALGGVAEWLAIRLRNEHTRRSGVGEVIPDKLEISYAPTFDEQFPETEEELVAQLYDELAELPPEEFALHRRLWQTSPVDLSSDIDLETQLEPTIGIIVEILDRFRHRIRAAEDDDESGDPG